jgi:aspartyl-tRNA(Asn)/glutamyl-tRNA(Gln) amidotransferase subunit C
MSFDPTTLQRLARLAALEIAPTDAVSLGQEMSSILALIDQLQAVDTTGVTPLAHPTSTIEAALRLRADNPARDIQREANMQNAPHAENGLFLVPKVLE